MHQSVALTRLTTLFVLLLALIIASHFLFEDTLGPVLRELAVTMENSFAAALMIAAGLTFDVLLPIPSSVLSMWAVISFGFTKGFLIVWLGMNAACLLGYTLGAGASKGLLGRVLSSNDLATAQTLAARFGTGTLVFTRAVPVIAEASVVSAGIAGMPFGKFASACLLSNGGIALAYAAAGSLANANASFALAFAGSIALPLLAFASLRIFTKTQKHSKVAHGEQLEPRFSMQFSYPLCFTRNVFDSENTTLISQLQRDKHNKRSLSAQFYLDKGLLECQPELVKRIEHYCDAHGVAWHCVSVPGGEKAKTLQQIHMMHDEMLQAGLDRQCYVIAIGGGGLLDAVGYAASTFHRGIRLIRMPTTVLAQNDAGIGVKNGVNDKGIKNLLGCFAVPHAIINDATFLDSLSKRDFRSGFAEAIKVALIRDEHFYHWISNNREALNQREEHAVYHLIKRCAQLHLEQICKGGDPFEQGSARPLDYGHWSAHKLESLTQHQLSHGEAVSIGMALDALYAVEIGLLSQTCANGILELIQSLGFELWHPALTWKGDNKQCTLLQGLEEFRQHLGGELCITLLKGIGETIEAHQIDEKALLVARDKLQRFCSQQPA
ncbi:3-dehydroquinate synthase [Alteromonadaceae bacterium Bs31]|nr:3-dehydroquinate synthase [Alteromonadaceae bacterium Bs31]